MLRKIYIQESNIKLLQQTYFWLSINIKQFKLILRYCYVM
jgi:hypothetical protein